MYYVLALNLFFGEAYEEVMRQLVNGLRFLGVAFDSEANAAHAACLHKTYSNVAIWVVPAEEERQIAREVLAVRAMEKRTGEMLR